MTARVPGDSTRLARGLAERCAQHPGKSGFFPLDEGMEAFVARLQLAKLADRTIDVQYYFIIDDVTGVLFIDSLLQAADRGVRVRVLLDDIRTRGKETGLAALSAHPEIEVRIFNPFASRTIRILDLITDFDRVNRRMHNKSFTVDEQATIVGGRNIGDEYFDARADLNFGDLDLLGVGPIAADVSRAFDEYWYSRTAKPIEAVAQYRGSERDLARRRRKFAERVSAARVSPYLEAASSDFDFQLERADLRFDWATAHVVCDSPDKVLKSPEEIPARTGPELREVIETSSELLLISPYLVPQDEGVQIFRELRDRGARIVIVTNSLASTDVAAVHVGYARYREALLETGVELWEIKPDVELRRRLRPRFGSSRSSLHAKFFIRDREQLFVGSFNWDPRSIRLNTEMGILVESPDIAAPFAERLLAVLPEYAYRVRLDENLQLQWLESTNGRESLHAKEPRAGIWRRLSARIWGLFPIEGQL